MASEHRHPTGEPGTGAVIGTQRPRTAQDLVADVAASETDKTAEAAVGEGEMVQTSTPPTKTDGKLGSEVRTDGKEVGRRRRDDGMVRMGTCAHPDVRCPQEKVGPAIWRPQTGR